MMTGALLVEKLYSQGYYIEKQREFSIISGSKKVINKLTKNVDDWINDKVYDPIKRTKLVKNLANKVQKDIQSAKQDILNSNSQRSIKERRKSVNSRAGVDKLVDIAENSGTVVNYDYSGKSNPFNTKLNKKNRKTLISLIDNNSKNDKIIKDILNEKNKDLINYSKGKGEIPSLAHEIGHVKNRRDGSIMDKVISTLTRKILPKFNKSTDSMNFDDGSKGILRSFGRKIKGDIVVKEEKNATEKGMKLLKNINVDDSTLRDSKDLLDSDLKHYKARRDLYYKIPLLKSLKPRKES